jgi:hypothetical protein
VSIGFFPGSRKAPEMNPIQGIMRWHTMEATLIIFMWHTIFTAIQWQSPLRVYWKKKLP